MLTFSHPGSRIQGSKSTQSRIPDPDPQHCGYRNVYNNEYESATQFYDIGLNMELNLQSLFGLLCTAVLIG
jgi:hypothetical protein